METLERIIREHPFFQGLDEEYIRLVTGCASNERFDAGTFLFRAGGEATRFYLIRHGQVALELETPAKGALTVETLTDGEVLGYSWLFPPYQWQFDAHAVSLVRALSIDGACLLDKCAEDPRFGYEMMRRFSQVIISRLQATRIQLLDIYAPGK